MKLRLNPQGNGNAMPLSKSVLSGVMCLGLFFSSCKKEISSSESELQESTALTAQSVSELKVSAPTEFGALISGGTIDQKMKTMKMLNVNVVRYAIILESHFETDKAYEKWENAGYKILLNLNWGHVSGPTGKRKAVPFPTDLKEYRRELSAVLDKYHPEVAVIENEPTTDVFHSGPIEDYIAQLKVAVDVCKQRGIKVADGGLNLELTRQVMYGNGRGVNYEETKKLIEAFKTIDLDFVNLHTKAPFSNQRNANQFQPGAAEEVADYLRRTTGKQVMCNEYNSHNTSTSLMTSAVDAFRAGGYRYFIPRSDNNSSDSHPLANEQGTKLTPLGEAYKNAIK